MDRTKELSLEKMKVLSQLRTLLGGMAYGVFGFIIAVAVFPLSVHPLGVALISFIPKKTHRFKLYGDFSFYMLCGGCILSTLTYPKNGIIYFTMYCALFFIRLALTSGKFNENRVTKMALALASSLCIGLVGGAIKGIGIWEILGILILSLCAPVFAFLFDGISDSEKSPVFIDAASGALLFAVLYGIKSVHILSFSLPMVISAFITLVAARKRGALYGALTGLVCGIASESFIMPPVFGILGFCAGIFFEYSDVFAILIAYVGAVCYGIYCSGFDAVGYLAPEFLIACAAFFPVKGFIPLSPTVPPMNDNGEWETEETHNDTAQLIKMSDAFSALSQLAVSSEKHDLPDKNECAHFVNRAFEDVCGKCVMQGICLMSEPAANTQIQKKLSEKLYNTSLSHDTLPEEMSTKCRYSEKIISSCLKHYRNAAGRRGISGQSRTLSGEYNTVSKLLKNAAKPAESYDTLPQSFKIKRALDNLGITHKTFRIKGSRRTVIDVMGICVSDIEVSAERIRAEFEKECGFSVAVPEFFVKGSSEVMRITRCPAISLEFAKAACAKSGESKNGDCISVFEDDNDCFYSLICDGMGSGRDAAEVSGIASGFMQKLIMSSSPKDISIEMLNNFLISKDNECFSTIDLVEIDKMDATASFIKAGAAPAFVVRKGKLHKISSNTPPAGILYNMTAEKTTMKLEKNDIIVMLSDGVIENGELAPDMMELMSYGLEGDTQNIADKIISAACEKSGRPDDMSVAVMRIA
ncbi:MAG: hypothetical protein E7588_04710 [Ruminococcaceae bacterium]|nr:hypothetical protein [Oscillospiraceae bacterium]